MGDTSTNWVMVVWAVCICLDIDCCHRIVQDEMLVVGKKASSMLLGDQIHWLPFPSRVASPVPCFSCQSPYYSNPQPRGRGVSFLIAAGLQVDIQGVILQRLNPQYSHFVLTRLHQPKAAAQAQSAQMPMEDKTKM
jgi:hypothetical protein